MHIKGAFASDGTNSTTAMEVLKRLAADTNFTYSLTQFSSKESEMNQDYAGVPFHVLGNLGKKTHAENTFIIRLPE